MSEKIRKVAYAFVADLIVFDSDTALENPELWDEILKIKETLRAAADIPSLEELPF